MSRTHLFVVILVIAAVHESHGLSCLGCNPADCRIPLNCNYGLVKDICYCCDVCAKGPGEECGGIWGLRGQCGDAFICDNSHSREMQPDYPVDFLPGVCIELAAERSRRAMGGGLSGGTRRAGNAKLQARQHVHKAFGDVPDEYKALLAAFLKNQNAKPGR
ncbi:uncharacterized protein [Palaemon carinicauda]|uniref:uncharacterized protein n=1 Tax=Palaemon carinicauda TaxID=392227 RepID=UPI0035B5E95B